MITSQSAGVRHSVMRHSDSTMSKSKSRVSTCYITLPFSGDWTCSPPAPAGSSFAVGSQRPKLPVASKFLPIVHWVVFRR